ncbi:hypothetical protein [Nocardiopsis tropica]|uniref:Uncharacterized protein n=1 Tax=Nocardiopsis tropica TaxID=109330 RepID=A0ABU7KM26_9ACTN|nr:hypothetical protein [Nocardiopsis umidischolae]MEE2050343.1 hypothetical protein [Nocardiopsis umidischolae]
MTTQSDQWRRVGEWLIARRTDLGYRQRTAFARDHARPKFGARVIIDMEGGVRDSYGDDAVIAAEGAYQIQPGTLRRALSGDIPEPIPAAPAAGPEPVVVQEEHILDTEIGQAAYTVLRELKEGAEGRTDAQQEELVKATAERIKTEIALFARMKRMEIEERRRAAQEG